jgi:hypothetical protein
MSLLTKYNAIAKYKRVNTNESRIWLYRFSSAQEDPGEFSLILTYNAPEGFM